MRLLFASPFTQIHVGFLFMDYIKMGQDFQSELLLVIRSCYDCLSNRMSFKVHTFLFSSSLLDENVDFPP